MSTTTNDSGTVGRNSIVAVFTATVFLSASLLFFVQPLFAKIVLPVTGGGPAVWNTAMLFFQAVLIVGYLYAHFSARFLSTRQQILLHLGIWAAALVFLPPALPENWQLQADKAIAPQILILFALGVGAPFALLSSNAPLIQSWYARSNGPSSDDPYFLYASSNFGSLLALLAFPLLAEPYFGASQISFGFTLGFLVFGVGLIVCGLLMHGNETPAPSRATISTKIGSIQMLTWSAYAFVPSSLMLAVTSKASTDIGAVPLIWVLPLALYLLSFVVSFNERLRFHPWSLSVVALSSIIGLSIMFVGFGSGAQTGVTIAFLFLGFFAVSVWAHRRLYELRPGIEKLTKFYLIMSLGGAAGGLFNSILAPALFVDLAEGPITLGIALLLWAFPILRLSKGQVLRGLCVGFSVGVILTVIARQIEFGGLALSAIIAVGLVLTLLLSNKDRATSLVSMALVVALPVWLAGPTDLKFADRSFFGLHRVLDRDGVRIYSNGNTIHGAQRLEDYGAERPRPLSYYHPLGPMGQVMQSPVGLKADRIGIVGLGIGSLTCYAQPGQSWHLYEIDALVDQVARMPGMFTFMEACAPDFPTHLGDARVILEGQGDLQFDVLVIDAYSSNSIPVHLTTQEAMQLYLDRLKPNGVLVFHISNRYYDVGIPLSRSAESLGVFAWRQFQTDAATNDPGFKASDVVLIAKTEEAVIEILPTGNWVRLSSDGGPVWTDDKANPLSVLKPGLF